MIIIAGLGNPDSKYENTRHNAGFRAIDELADKYGIEVTERKHRAYVGKGSIGGEKVLLMKPQTYMNLSGESIGAALRFYNEAPENLIVLCDDVYLDMGVLRIREKGSAGGHNGLKNIIQEIGSDAFKRVRIGVGKQPEKTDLINFVLSRFTKAEQETMAEAYKNAADAAAMIVTDGAYKAMNSFNGKSVKQAD